MNKTNVGYTAGVVVGILVESARALLVEHVGVNTVLEHIAIVVIMVAMISVGRWVASEFLW